MSEIRAAVLHEVLEQHLQWRTLKWRSHNAATSFTVLRVLSLVLNELGLLLADLRGDLSGRIAGMWV